MFLLRPRRQEREAKRGEMGTEEEKWERGGRNEAGEGGETYQHWAVFSATEPLMRVPEASAGICPATQIWPAALMAWE